MFKINAKTVGLFTLAAVLAAGTAAYAHGGVSESASMMGGGTVLAQNMPMGNGGMMGNGAADHDHSHGTADADGMGPGNMGSGNMGAGNMGPGNMGSGNMGPGAMNADMMGNMAEMMQQMSQMMAQCNAYMQQHPVTTAPDAGKPVPPKG